MKNRYTIVMKNGIAYNISSDYDLNDFSKLITSTQSRIFETGHNRKFWILCSEVAGIEENK